MMSVCMLASLALLAAQLSQTGGNEPMDKSPAMAQRTRCWNSQGEDENSMHALGNGRMIVLAAGPNIDCLFGPPYTSPNILQMKAFCQQTLEDRANRELGRAVWHHVMTLDGKPALRFIEFAASGVDAYMRLFTCVQEGIAWSITPHPSGGFKPSPNLPGVFMQTIKPGSPIYRDVKITDQCAYHWIIPQGTCRISQEADGCLLVHVSQGEGSLALVGAIELPTGLIQVEEILGRGCESYLEPMRRCWDDFTRLRMKNAPELESIPEPYAEDLDGIAVMMKAQQASEGPCIIGWHAPMAYIRDLYGAARGMLALGMFEEARQSMEFRYGKYKRFGDLRTAEFIGTDCARHTYNDEVEGPAYVILQARDYLRRTGDIETIRKIWDMLEWCWFVQQKQLAHGLLPFNGDETYIPYGLFPIDGLLQGSADTTLAFIACGEWLINYAEKERFWTSSQAEKQRAILSTSRQAWRKSFVDCDRIWANAPERTEWIEPPRFRFNSCQGNCGQITWTEYDSKSQRYLCQDCLNKKLPHISQPARMTLNSVSLLPNYLGSELLKPTEQLAIAERILSRARPNGAIPTCNEEDCPPERANLIAYAAGGGLAGRIGDLCVGYDPGLLLILLTDLKHPSSPQAFQRMMRLLDQAGAWNEYYDARDQPVHGCIRANMWASGINAEAAVHFLLKKDQPRSQGQP